MRTGLLLALPLWLATHAVGSAQQSPAQLGFMPACAADTPAPAAPAPSKDVGMWKPAADNPALLSTDSPPRLNCNCPTSAPPFRVWASVDYLMWWVKDAPVGNGPIVTTSSSFTDRPPGALGQPGTSVLFGNSPIGYGMFNGMKVSAGAVLSSGLLLEGSYFALERRSGNFGFASNAQGSPLLGIAIFNTAIGIPDSLLTSNPDTKVGPWSGTAVVESHLRLQGWDVNTGLMAWNSGGLSVKGLAGFRALSLDEDLGLMDVFTPQVANNLTFLGQPVPANTVLTDFDKFSTTNHFYGGQLGGRVNWQSGAFSLNVLGMIALGGTQQTVTINGVSTSTPPGGVTQVAPGGIYAQTSNIGSYSRNVFSVVPEAGLSIGWKICPNVTATLGYTFLYWTGVARPGDQVDYGVNQTLVPTHQSFGLTPSDGRPAFAFHSTDFWAQGINLGVVVRY